MERCKNNSHLLKIMEKIKRGTNWIQHAFNFTLEKMICLKKHNNNIKVGLFCLYFKKKKWKKISYILGHTEFLLTKKQI